MKFIVTIFISLFFIIGCAKPVLIAKDIAPDGKLIFDNKNTQKEKKNAE